MKHLFIFTISLLITQVYYAQAESDYVFDSFIKKNRGTFNYPKNPSGIKESLFKRKYLENQKTARLLGSIKYEMINGNLERAKVMLLQSKYSEGFSRMIQYRYLGMIHFIEGDYKQSQEFLTHKDMYRISTDDTICLLRTLNYVILDEVSKASLEWNRCLDATVNKSPTSHVWMNTILKLKLNDEPDITAIPLQKVNIENEKGDFLRLYLKMALYLNQQDKIFKRLSFLSESAFQDTEIRELIGMLYYREGKLAMAYQFVEDLNSPNSENIKGNLYLAQKKYEMAYGQFKLALKSKLNSQNALERIIPVAWILKQWKDGLDFISKLKVPPKDKYSKLAIKAAFLTQDGQYKQAQKELKKIVAGSNDAQSSEVNQLMAYNSIMLKDKQTSEIYASKACQLQDGLNCWMLYQFAIWENFALTLHRKDKILSKGQNLISQYTKSFNKDPLKEEVFINQKDIEELDNDIIRLLPNIRD